MKHILHIFIASIFLSGIISCNDANQSDVQDVVIVGGDTLGKNWDNLPSKEEAEQLRQLGITPEQYAQMQLEQQQQDQSDASDNTEQDKAANEAYDQNPYNGFSDQMYKEHTYTVETTDGREVVVGSSSKY